MQLTEKQKGLQEQLKRRRQRQKPAKRLTKGQVKTYLAGVDGLAVEAGDGGRGLVLSLIEPPTVGAEKEDIRRRTWLGGLLSYYYRQVACVREDCGAVQKLSFFSPPVAYPPIMPARP